MNVPNKAVLRMLSGAWRHAGLVVTVLIAFGAGYLVRWGCAPAQVVSTPPTTAAHLRAHDHTQAPALWTCSMHPEIKRDGPGLCPKCNMPLVPVAARRGDEGSLREFATSAEGRPWLPRFMAERLVWLLVPWLLIAAWVGLYVIKA